MGMTENMSDHLALIRIRETQLDMLHRQKELHQRQGIIYREIKELKALITSMRSTEAQPPSRRFTDVILDPLSAPMIKWATGILIIIYLAKGGDPSAAIGWLTGIK
jgi:hypothetical protein